jgi:hypothetical protein
MFPSRVPGRWQGFWLMKGFVVPTTETAAEKTQQKQQQQQQQQK